jgi:hypothetical protein
MHNAKTDTSQLPLSFIVRYKEIFHVYFKFLVICLAEIFWLSDVFVYSSKWDQIIACNIDSQGEISEKSNKRCSVLYKPSNGLGVC